MKATYRKTLIAATLIVLCDQAPLPFRTLQSKHRPIKVMAEVVNIDAEVEPFLNKGGLGVSDLAQSQNLQLFGIRRAARLVGVVGIEAYGPVGLLRSLTVTNSYRRTGFGHDLVSHAETGNRARHPSLLVAC